MEKLANLSFPQPLLSPHSHLCLAYTSCAWSCFQWHLTPFPGILKPTTSLVSMKVGMVEVDWVVVLWFEPVTSRLSRWSFNQALSKKKKMVFPLAKIQMLKFSSMNWIPLVPSFETLARVSLQVPDKLGSCKMK